MPCSFDASATSGVTVYDTTPHEGAVLGWLVAGGTFVASPAMAARIKAAGNRLASSKVAELTTV